MFGSEDKKQAKREAEARRIAEAGAREQEKVDAEKANRTPSSLHKIEYLDGVLNERADRKDKKRVERAQKREAKAIRKEKNRKYWWLALVVLALVAGGAGGYLLHTHLDRNADYENAVSLVLDKDFKAAELILSDKPNKAGQKLYTYANLRNTLSGYDKHLDEYVAALEEIGELDDKDVNAQYQEYLEKLKPIGELQASINELDIDALSLSDKARIEELDEQVEKTNEKYRAMLSTTKLKEAKIKLMTLEEAADQLKNRSSQSGDDETGTSGETEATTEAAGSGDGGSGSSGGSSGSGGSSDSTTSSGNGGSGSTEASSASGGGSNTTSTDAAE